MCNFFSFDSDGNGNYYYFNWEQRQELMKGNPKKYLPDSHTSIADFYGFVGEEEDKLNKYEYNPLTGVFTKDKINTTDDSEQAEKWVRSLDFKTICESLIIEPIIQPFKLKKARVTEKDMFLLKEWASVWDSVGGSVGGPVMASVGGPVGGPVMASVWDSVWDSVGPSVRDSVWASVRASVWDSVRASVWDSVWDSVWAYIANFFNIKFQHDFSSAVKLWEKGLVSSFDGKIWRLHSGEKAEVVFEITKEKLMEVKP